ncbi:MAG: hypothetical protein ABIR06_09635 [Cyclobacteriaceae bacterium]
MGWLTVYITGKSDFREDVQKKLESSELNFMPGYTGSSAEAVTYELYWLDENITIRKFKEAVGSKMVWKYRLEFFTNLEAFIESQNPKSETLDFTPEETALLAKMQSAEYNIA